MSESESVRVFLLQQVADQLVAIGIDPADVPDDLDLVARGVLDSLGLIELIAAIETRFSVELDLEGLDVDALGVVGPFSRYIADRIASNPARP